MYWIGHFSKASIMTVWLVYAMHRVNCDQAASHVKLCSSIMILINSGMARIGCVSLSWNTK